MNRTALLILLSLLACCGIARAQDRPTGIRLFLDCSYRCDDEFMKTEIPIVDFVRERQEADIHLLVTTEGTASGGDVYTLAFLGRRRFQGVSDTLSITVSGTDSDDEVRRAVTKAVQLGLGPYLVRADLTADVGISFGPLRGDDRASMEADPWNYWVFSVSANAMLNGEASSRFLDTHGNVSANRTTEDLKIRASASGSISEQRFDVGDGWYRSTSRRGDFSFLGVKSVGPRWSAGVKASAGTSTYSNTDVSLSVGPAVEHDVFPYSETTRRELRIQYGVQLDSYWYDEETIFNLKDERLLKHYLSISLDMKQPWGSVTVSTTGRHLLTNFDRSLLDAYNLSVFAGGDVRIVRGLSFNVFGNYSLIRDQLSLPLSEATEQEVLLRTRRLQTGYDYFVSFGFSYRFGSIFNNVVNPRFGSGGGRDVMIIM